MTFGEWARKMRGDRTQQEIATQIRVSRACIAQWEAGTTKPHPLRRWQVENVLGKIPKAVWK
jgi:DNA-binding XRE family transcriptional regulator